VDQVLSNEADADRYCGDDIGSVGIAAESPTVGVLRRLVALLATRFGFFVFDW